MVKQVQHVRHDTAGANAYTGLIGEFTLEYTNYEVRLHDGATPGGYRVLNSAQIAALYQPLDADLTAISALTTTAFGRGLLTETNASTTRTTLGLAIGSDVQAYSAQLAAFAGASSAADKLAYFSGVSTVAVADFTAAGRTLVGALDALAQRTALGVVIGTNVQAWDTDLDWVASNITSAGKALLDDADATAQRTTLGLGTAATLDSDTDTTLAANSDVRFPTQKAVKAYVTAQVTANSAPDLTSDVGQLYLAVARLDTPTSPNAGGTQVADEFDDSTGIGSLGGGTVASGYLSNSAGGYTSNLCSGGTALEDSHSSSLVAANAFDGDSGTYWQSNVTGAGANGVAYIGYSFATAQHIRQIVFTGYDGTYYVSSWLVQRKVSGTWTTVTTIAPAATSSAQTFAIPASDAQTDWRLLANATPSSTYVHCKEMQMMAANAASNITTVSNAYTALTAPSTVSFVVEHQDVSTTAAVNTDIIVSASRDGGTTWTAVTLTDFGPSPISGARVLKGSATVSGQPSGTAIKWKVETANAKEQRVHGLWMQWK